MKVAVRSGILRAACAVVVVAILAACGTTTGPAGDAPDLRGTWSYQAQQIAPAYSLSGTLVVSEQTGRTFAGQLQVVETDQAGAQRQRAGLVTGTAGASTIDFDAFLDATARRHVGRVTRDSVTGSWVSDATSGSPLSGTFRLRRARVP